MTTTEERIPAVFDCMIFLQAAARQTSPAAACFDLVREGFVELFVSAEILEEVEGVFDNSRFRERFRSLTDEMTRRLLEKCESTRQLSKR